MASGHVNRTNRPNTWLHRPSLRREKSPCQLGAVHTWHFATGTDALNFRLVWEHCGHKWRRAASGNSVEFDPARAGACRARKAGT